MLLTELIPGQKKNLKHMGVMMKKFYTLNLALLIVLSSRVNASNFDEYQQLSASEKGDYLWNEMERTKYQTLPKWNGREFLPILSLALPWNGEKRQQYISVSVERRLDFMPEGRKKLVHTYGSTAKFNFEASDNPYSGIFATGGEGIVRFSLAVDPRFGVLPGAAFKFLIDGEPSENIQVMHALAAQKNYNFFEKSFSNILPMPQSPFLKPLISVFEAGSKTPNKVGLDHLAKIDRFGNRIMTDDINSPEMIVLEPNSDLDFSDKKHEIRNDFSEIPDGTLLYVVYAQLADGEKIYLGEIFSSSRFVASSFGDEVLFFHHKRFNDQ